MTPRRLVLAVLVAALLGYAVAALFEGTAEWPVPAGPAEPGQVTQPSPP